MTLYLDAAILINGLIDFLLLVGTEKLMGRPIRWSRLLLSAGVGGIYAGMALMPEFAFLGNLLWRCVFMMIMSSIAFGFQTHAITQGALFLLLSMALGGVAAAMERRDVASLLAAGAGLAFLCKVGFWSVPGTKKLLPAKLCYGDREISVVAFHDTGNSLRDPITGEQVLVAGAEVAGKLLSLEPWQLNHPIEAMEAIPGMRLIPYHAIGNPGGMLLAVRLPKVEVGSFRGPAIIAFAPEDFSEEYQVLTGGVI